MAQAYVQLPDDSGNTGKKEDHWALPSAQLREAVVIGGKSDAEIAPVSATLGLAVDAKTLAPDAATQTTLAALNTKVIACDTDDVTVTASALPTGAATLVAQGTGNTSLAAINTNDGATTDAAVTGDNAGTISAKLRGLNKILADVWDSGSHWLKVSIQNATLATVEVPPTTVLNGKKAVTTAGTRVTLAGSTACKSVTVKALAANGGIIYVGDSSVASTNGFQLAAGDSVSLDIANLSTVNLDCSVSGEGVTYLGVA